MTELCLLVHTCPGQNSPMIFPTLSSAQAGKEDKTFARFVTCVLLGPLAGSLLGAVCQAAVQGPGGALCQPGPQPGRGSQDGDRRLRRSPGGRVSDWRDRAWGRLAHWSQKGVREGGKGSSALGSGRIIESVRWGVEKEMRESLGAAEGRGRPRVNEREGL